MSCCTLVANSFDFVEVSVLRLEGGQDVKETLSQTAVAPHSSGAIIGDPLRSRYAAGELFSKETCDLLTPLCLPDFGALVLDAKVDAADAVARDVTDKGIKIGEELYRWKVVDGAPARRASRSSGLSATGSTTTTTTTCCCRRHHASSRLSCRCSTTAHRRVTRPSRQASM